MFTQCIYSYLKIFVNCLISYVHTYLNSNIPVLQEIHTSNSLSLVPTDMTWMHSDVSNGLVDFPLARPFFDKSEMKFVHDLVK